MASIEELQKRVQALERKSEKLRNLQAVVDSNPYRSMLLSLEKDLDEKETENIRFFIRGKLNKKELNERQSMLQLMIFMEQEGLLASDNVEMLTNGMESIGRGDLIDRIRKYQGLQPLQRSEPGLAPVRLGSTTPIKPRVLLPPSVQHAMPRQVRHVTQPPDKDEFIQAFKSKLSITTQKIPHNNDVRRGNTTSIEPRVLLPLGGLQRSEPGLSPGKLGNTTPIEPKRTDFEIQPAPDSLFFNTPNPAMKTDPATPVTRDNMTSTPTSQVMNMDLKTPTSSIKSSTSKKRKSIFPQKSDVKKIKLTRAEEFLDEEHSVNSISSWLPKYNLAIADKHTVESGLMDDMIINAALDILKRDFPDIHGFQNVLYAPHFSEHTRSWTINKLLHKQNTPCVQIHHNGSNHWVTSYRKHSTGSVYVLDSLKNTSTVNTSIRIQLSQIYDAESNNLMEIPDVQRQTNSSDCGVFAIAYATELAHCNFEITNVQFDIPAMRLHLIKCLENDKFEPFPKEM